MFRDDNEIVLMERGTLPDDLVSPEAYPAPRPTSISLRTTHSSWVFITDVGVWKVKRPVDYGFLDFSTAALRRRCCLDEVRLGRRLAPDVYLGVVPIRRGAHGHIVGEGPDVVDWAVHMRRLPDEDSGSSLVARGLLGHGHLACLSRSLAPFYERAAPTPEYGTLAALGLNVAENFDQVRPFVGRHLPSALFDEVRRWQEQFLAAHELGLVERVRAGKVREGHGDLRLEHVYFPAGVAAEPAVIDPIEFNLRFRCADIALDAAFLAMDLEQHGRRDLGEWFLGRFALDTNDYGFYPLVDFYLSYRAWVRGKVACFVAADPTVPPEKARRKAEEAERLFVLAAGHARPRPGRRAVLVVAGLPGAGKTTVAEALARQLSFPIVSSDRTRKALAGVPPGEPAGSASYTAAFTARTYDELLRRAERVVQSGRGVILDATFRTAPLRARARTLAASHGLPFLYIELTAEDAALRRRLRARAASRSISDADEAVLDRLRQELESPDELPSVERLRIDTTRGWESVPALVRERLDSV